MRNTAGLADFSGGVVLCSIWSRDRAAMPLTRPLPSAVYWADVNQGLRAGAQPRATHLSE
jgi:hypothetical protein